MNVKLGRVIVIIMIGWVNVILIGVIVIARIYWVNVPNGRDRQGLILCIILLKNMWVLIVNIVSF